MGRIKRTFPLVQVVDQQICTLALPRTTIRGARMGENWRGQRVDPKRDQRRMGE
jgi:hypothetical protein